MKIKRVIAALMCAALAVCGLAACNTEGSDLAYITDKKTLIVGVTEAAPMDFTENGQWTGFDAEFALAFAEKLGVEVKFQEINWEMKESELAAKTIDCIWNGMTWTEERAENMSLGEKYLKNRQVVVVKAENAANYASAADLAGVSVAAENGSAGAEYIEEALTDSVFIDKVSQLDSLTEVVAGTADAAVLDYTMANYLINAEGSSFAGLTILDIVEGEDEYYAVAFRKGSDATAKFNEIYAELKEDGTIADLAAKYGLADLLA